MPTIAAALPGAGLSRCATALAPPRPPGRAASDQKSMGISISHAAAPPPPPPVVPPPAHPLGLGVVLPPPAEEKKDDTAEKVDYTNLPCPVPFEEIQREALSTCNTFSSSFVEVFS